MSEAFGTTVLRAMEAYCGDDARRILAGLGAAPEAIEEIC